MNGKPNKMESVGSKKRECGDDSVTYRMQRIMLDLIGQQHRARNKLWSIYLTVFSQYLIKVLHAVELIERKRLVALT